ncbi:uncharacterized protein MELLADRAFT_106637 [Melampsora larici-populina 98AG31]|uniref:Uncharacterized protein n=1 Tax=Melampsora larici-populina (strain 98AG31 / pathotype 3-4-7) TaxID=747676 RepID=F4RM55_MELLP|nr:uncharacterized protein MELLADRAFT_106637 [Melampsora larici-populina 98AG31]EGG06530.1 hypothetical protein MELLADRAFT_106637 [Melampsora larici-populina 98AG31]
MKLIQTSSSLFKNQFTLRLHHQNLNPILYKNFNRSFLIIHHLNQNTKEPHKDTQQFTKPDPNSKKVPTDSEEHVRAEKDDRSTKTLQKETIKEVHETHHTKNKT